MKTVIFKISGMHCVSCSMNIDLETEELEGVQSSKTNYAKSETIVTYDPKKVTVKNLQSVITKLGYSVLE